MEFINYLLYIFLHYDIFLTKIIDMINYEIIGCDTMISNNTGGMAMKKKRLSKCFFTLGFLLFFTIIIPFTSWNTATAYAGIIVKEKNEDYRLNLKSITLVKGRTFTLKAYNLSETTKISFKSDNDEIASVSEDGVITANKVGNAVITVAIKDGTSTSSLSCDVTVGPPAVSIKWTKSRIILGLDNVDYLNYIIKPYNTAESARFSSLDSSIVSISTGARITAKKLGFTYLFAEINDTNSDGSRKFAVCYVIVTSSDNVSSLNNYFNEHPELYLISEIDLSKALDDFFNGKTTSFSGESDSNKSNLISTLNSYLDEKFDLDALKATLSN